MEVMAMDAIKTVIPEGYKMTELGVIPVEWQVKYLEDIVEFLDGKRKPIKNSDRAKMQGQYPYYGASGIIDYVNDFLFNDNLILFGEDGENILSRNLRLVFQVNGKCWVNNHAHVLKPSDKINITFLTEYLESLDYEQYNTGTAQPKINQKVCSKIRVLVPPLPEQTAIATALSDIDELIKTLDTLIAKKRHIKQGAMQRLLTPPDKGGVRLEGFSGAWEVNALSSIAIIERGKFTPRPRNNPIYYNGDIPFVQTGDVTKSKGRITTYSQTLNEKGLSVSKKFRKGTILMTIAANIGYSGILEIDMACPDSLIGITGVLANNFFLNQYFIYKREEIEDLSTSGAQKNLSIELIKDFPIPIPPLPEQTAIATILSDIDTEIASLAAKRTKYQAIKQGMMEELLTGRIRLL